MAAPQHSTQRKTRSPSPRRFTVGEANRALPLVRRIVRDIVTTHRRAADTQAKLESATSVKEAKLIQQDLESAVDRLQEYVDELTDIGCELKDYETGLIDFPGRHKGHLVSLCWRLGEEKVDHWHELEAGLAGRQSIATLDESE